MKKLITIALMAVIGFTASAQSKKDSKISETTFKVEIDCNSCKQKIEKSIPFEKGVKDVNIDMEAKTVKVKYDNTKTDVEKLQAAFKKIGKTAEAITITAAPASACCKDKAHANCSKTCDHKDKKEGCCKNHTTVASSDKGASQKKSCCSKH